MTTPDGIRSLAKEIAAAISLLADERRRLRHVVSGFEADFGTSRVDAWLLTIEGCPASREAAKGHGAAAQTVTRLLHGNRVAARLELFALPWFRRQTGAALGCNVDARFAQAAAGELDRRLKGLADIEAAGRLDPPFLVPQAFAAYQPMADQLGLSWGRYLDDAFRSAARIEPEAFPESWLCQVLYLEDDSLSQAFRDTMGGALPLTVG